MIIKVSTPDSSISIPLPDNTASLIFNEFAMRLIAASTRQIVAPSEPAPADQEEDSRSDPAENQQEEPAEDEEAGKPSLVGHADQMKRYSGFLYVECQACGERRAFNSKYPISHYVCKCGEQTPLDPLVKASAICPGCRQKWRYQTNVEDPSIELNCISCGSPMDLWWDAKKKKYRTIV